MKSMYWEVFNSTSGIIKGVSSARNAACSDELYLKVHLMFDTLNFNTFNVIKSEVNRQVSSRG